MYVNLPPRERVDLTHKKPQKNGNWFSVFAVRTAGGQSSSRKLRLKLLGNHNCLVGTSAKQRAEVFFFFKKNNK